MSFVLDGKQLLVQSTYEFPHLWLAFGFLEAKACWKTQPKGGLRLTMPNDDASLSADVRVPAWRSRRSGGVEIQMRRYTLALGGHTTGFLSSTLLLSDLDG